MLAKLSVPVHHPRVRRPQPAALHPNPDLSSLTVTDLQVGMADPGVGVYLTKLLRGDIMAMHASDDTYNYDYKLKLTEILSNMCWVC